MSPTRALIIRQPWIHLILNDGKTWEMRSAPTNVRGRIGLIEAGTRLNGESLRCLSCMRRFGHGVFGLIGLKMIKMSNGHEQEKEIPTSLA